MKTSTLFVVLAIAITSFPTLAAELPYPICPTEMEQQIIDLINGHRVDSGLTVLEVDRRLILSSRRHSNDIGLHELLSHIGSDGSTFEERAEDEGYTNVTGEVIGAGCSSAAAMVAAWMSSDLHRAILLSSYARHIGAGYAQYQNMYEHWYTVDFGRALDYVPPDCSCCAGRVGDANGNGEDEPTVGDVSVLIDAKFITGSCDGILECLTEADINQSGGSVPDCDDVTIGDISTLIDYLFITGSTLGLPDCL